MYIELPAAGAAGSELAAEVRDVWLAEAIRAGLDVGDYDPAAPLGDRLAWAARRGLTVATVLSRYSSSGQRSTTDQVRECTAFAAANGLFVPPEYVCVDEGTTGRRLKRDGVERMRRIIGPKLARTLVVFKLSRLFRKPYKGFELFQEELVEQGLRGISVSQGIDTANEKSWEMLTVLHGLSDSMLLTASADHIRSGLFGLARQGYTVGALTTGYRRKELPGARPTVLGKPRTVPEVDPDAAPHIRRAFEGIRDGLSLRDARRRYNAEGGPVDGRSTTGRMSETAFRRLLANPRYTGRWAFGRFRSVWSTTRDYNLQVRQPDSEVVFAHREELRIVDDGLFYEVQEKLARLKRHGPTGPKRRKQAELWDLVVDCFRCAACDARFYLNGGDRKGMRCKNGPDCPKGISLRREPAVRAVCDELVRVIAGDAEFVSEVVAAAERVDAAGEEGVRTELARVRKRIAALGAKVDELEELAGEGGAEGRRQRKQRILAAEEERARLRGEEARLAVSLGGGRDAVTPGRVRELLADRATLLAEGAAGRGDEAQVRLAAEVFRRLVGGRIDVHAPPRPGRKRPYVRGVFTPALAAAARYDLRLPRAGETDAGSVDVSLRPVPRSDRLAERVHGLLKIEGLTLTAAADRLRADGETITPMGVKHILRRHQELAASASI